MELKFSLQMFEEYSNIMKIRLAGADGRTDLTELLVAFRSVEKSS